MAVAAAADGDTVKLLAGVHRGPLRIERAIVLCGAPGAMVDGGGRGSVLVVTAPGTVTEDLEVRGSGARVLTVDSGIRVVSAPGCVIRRVRLRDVLYGIYAERCDSLEVVDCDLVGRVEPLHEDGQGNGIHLWYSQGARLVGNRATRFADAVYLSFVNGAEARGNELSRNGRYGLHTMYCQQTHITENRFENNVAGCAIMFSNRLQIADNDFFRHRGPRAYGLLLRDCSDGRFENNRLVENTIALFLDNSNRNALRRNLFQDNGWGVLMYSSCAGNTFAANSFIGNDYAVALDMRHSSNRFDDGRQGNYWSGHSPYDLDGDGVGDTPFSPVSSFAFLSKRYPDLTVLAKSPAVAALGVAERVLPALQPSELVDGRPRLMPTRTTGSGRPLRRAGAKAVAWLPASAFALLVLVGLAGLAVARRVT